MILGLSGLSGCGKDTIADILTENYGFVKVSLADPLKRYLKEVYDFSDKQLWGPSQWRNAPDHRYPRSHTWPAAPTSCLCCGVAASEYTQNPHKYLCYLTPRYALQLLGTEWGRHCYTDTWVDHALRTARRLLSEKEDLAYDARFGLLMNSAWVGYSEEVRSAYTKAARATGVVIPDCRFENELVKLPSKIRIKRPGYDKPKWDHPSETEQLRVPDSEFNYLLSNDAGLEELPAKVEEMLRSFEG